MAVSVSEGPVTEHIRVGDFNLHRIGFGAMRLTGPGIWGEFKDREEAIRILRTVAESGVDFIDTADAYGPETSENLIAEALFPYRGMVIATKGGLTRPGPGVWVPNCSPKHLREACEASLRRLKIDTIDLYQLHTVDPKVPFEESFKTLLDLQREGKIRYIGLSNIRPDHFNIAMDMGGFVSVQNNYNLLNREHEDVLRLCEQHSVAFIPYFPMSGNDTSALNLDKILSIAKKYNSSPNQIALAWLLNHSPNILPIPGTSSLSHFKENMESIRLNLAFDDISELDRLWDEANLAKI